MKIANSNVVEFNSPDDQILTLKISLLGMKPQIWRRVQVPATYTLGDFHYVIQIAMGWENDHLHAFRIGGRSFAIPMEDDLDGSDEDSDMVTLAKLGLSKPGAKFNYEYDFGDGWEHEITVETVTKRNKNRHYPQCLKAVRACPPEDCGGVPGFARLLKIMKNPNHSEYEDTLEWLGEGFDPKFVDVDEINETFTEAFTT
jgi:hypothetical protein